MPFKSKAQARKFFQLRREGKVSAGTLNEWVKSTPSIKALPERLTKKSFVVGFEKVAAIFSMPKLHVPVAPVAASTSKAVASTVNKVTSSFPPKPLQQSKGHMDRAIQKWNNRMLNKTSMSMTDQAALEVTNMADRVPGTELRDKAETGQARGRATRTFNVKNEDREFGSKFRRTADTARGGRIYGSTR